MVFLVASMPMIVMAVMWSFLSPCVVDGLFNDQVLSFMIGIDREEVSTAAWAASEVMLITMLTYVAIGFCFALLTHFKPLSDAQGDEHV